MPSQSLISQPGKHGFEHTMDDHKFIILGHCPHDEVRLTAGALQVSQEQPSAIAGASHRCFPFLLPEESSSLFIRSKAGNRARRRYHGSEEATLPQKGHGRGE